ncbi:hypothetical protein EYZ11_005750 [Aspergillus tanneri]|uniref:Uncharacterized protein n=1 Tax=Aspergillus tanneri TaxID=1220188 RepID=A0A4S3JJM3_9EURO|nr:hypothetical protein EYZ11_005750 [Aspergillus tanneri]
MNNVFSVNEDDSLDSLPSNSTFSVASQGVFLQIGLEVAITLISQVDEVIAPADTPGNTFMFAKVAIDATFNFESTSAIDEGFI